MQFNEVNLQRVCNELYLWSAVPDTCQAQASILVDIAAWCQDFIS